MNLDLVTTIQNEIVSKLGKEDNNFILLKHYNALFFTEEDKRFFEEKNQNIKIIVHDYKLSSMVGVFEPFFTFAREEMKDLSDNEIDEILEECDVYKLHRSVFKSFFKTGICKREETLLIDEVAFEQEKIATALVRIVLYLAKEQPILYLLNDLQYANGSSYHFIHNMLEDVCETTGNKNLAIVATYNEAKIRLTHIEPLWNKFYAYIYENELVWETSLYSLECFSNLTTDFEFKRDELDKYIESVNNLLFCLDFVQAKYYLEIIYKMITVEEMDIGYEYEMKILNLYTLVSIYTQDFSQALLLCEKIRQIKEEIGGLTVEYRYYYFMALAHMYNGKLEEAAQYADKSIKIANIQGIEYDVFLAKMMQVMIKMSGWHNIFFCANDLVIDTDIIILAYKYNFMNHLAHIYVYAYDNDSSLFSDVTRLDERLLHFNKGIEIMKEIGNDYFMMEAYRNNIMIASTNGFFKTANYYYDKCHEMIRGKNVHEEAMIYNGVGYISSAMEEYDKAFECYNTALMCFLGLEEIDYVGETLYNMAINSIMAQDYKNAYQYLEFAFKIVKQMKLNSLRVCNISKLTGLLALCSYYNGNDLMCSIYTEKTRLFLEHLFERENEDNSGVIMYDYVMCNDDLFIYYYVSGMLLIREHKYEDALKKLEIAAGCIDESVGNQFYLFKQYISELANLYKKLGMENEAKSRLVEAIAFYDRQGCAQKVMELKAQLNNQTMPMHKYNWVLSAKVCKKIEDVLRHVAVNKSNQEYEKRMSFMAAWQKMMEIGSKKKNDLVMLAVNSFIHNFNIDKLMIVKYDGEEPGEIYNNTGYVFEGKRREELEKFFKRNRLGFVTSKINNNYVDFSELVGLFEREKICSIIGIPFYSNDSLKAIMIAYITMKDNWHSPTNRYLLDEGDCAVFEFLIRQLLNAIDMQEALEKINQMNEKLNHLAVTDKLTGLYNREGFYYNIKKMLKEQTTPIAMLYTDLDNFKKYNDTYGHDVGDLVLKEMANIFEKAVGNKGFNTRYGGDEFVIILHTNDRIQIENVIQKIYDMIEEANGFENIVSKKIGKDVVIKAEERLSCSIGVSCIEMLNTEKEVEGLIQQADDILYNVKKSGKGFHMFAE